VFSSGTHDDDKALSALKKTWIIDLDGTIVRHNGYLTDGKDTLLEGAEEFLNGIPEDDMVIILTSRQESERESTLRFLKERGIRFDLAIFGAPNGERILINDMKPSGLRTAISINTVRDRFLDPGFRIDRRL